LSGVRENDVDGPPLIPGVKGPAWDGAGLESPHTQPDKADRVRRMFNAIAPTYERVNSIFSGGLDAYWRRRAVALAQIGPPDLVLDVACGTGDLARAMAARGPRRVVGCDFAHDMLVRAGPASLNRPARHGQARTPGRCTVRSLAEQAAGRLGESSVERSSFAWIEADALRLPLADKSVTAVGCAFGVRNFQDLDHGLREMHRVLAEGGRAVILEFTRPTNHLIREAYEFYASRLMPVLASWVSGDREGAYRYLPCSVVSFVGAAAMVERMRAAGFSQVRATPLTFGVVTVYLAYKATADRPN